MFYSFQNRNQKLIIGLGIAVFILAAAGFTTRKVWKPALVSFWPQDSGQNPAVLPPVATTSPREPAGMGTPPPVSAVTPLYQGEPVHIMEADPEVLKQIPAETYQKSRAELADLAVKLAENPRRPDDWMRVAFIKRFYHDYLGARDAYEYLNRIAESNPIPFYNLGSLYGYYLKEPQKAIPKFEAAIRRDPRNISFYTGFADFYREVMNDLPSAEKILLEGLAKAPAADANISIALGALYKVMGDTVQAIEYYEKALASPAMESGQKGAITAELERLKQTLESK